jgi:hypothetical protein
VTKILSENELALAAIDIADTVRTLDSDQRAVLYTRIAVELRAHSQGFTAQLFEVIADIDAGRRPL